MTTNNFSKYKGFTLVETLVAIAILLIAVVGPISLIGDALHKLYYAKDQMIAINLAQEGIEVVRQVRDTNMLKATADPINFAWNDGIVANNYIIDVNSTTPITFSSGGSTPQPVYIDANGFYVQTAGSATQFRRIVLTEDVAGAVGRELKVTSTVTWTTGGQVGTITVTEYLFKWAIP